MNVIVVDTSVWVEFFKGVTFPEIELALQESRVVLPPIVVAELFSGKMPVKIHKTVEQLVYQLGVIPTDINHWIEVGNFRSRLFAKGFSVSTPDAHVAYCAISLNCRLVSIDNIFRKIAANSALKLASLL